MGKTAAGNCCMASPLLPYALRAAIAAIRALRAGRLPVRTLNAVLTSQ